MPRKKTTRPAIDATARRAELLLERLVFAVDQLRSGVGGTPETTAFALELQDAIERSWIAWHGHTPHACAYLALAREIHFCAHARGRDANLTDTSYRSYEIDRVLNGFSEQWPEYAERIDRGLLGRVIDAWPNPSGNAPRQRLFYELIVKTGIIADEEISSLPLDGKPSEEAKRRWKTKFEEISEFLKEDLIFPLK